MEEDFKFDNQEDEHDWKKEWVGMPEFIQLDKESKKSVIIHFENWEDMEAFAKLVGREITPSTKSFFFPVKKKGTSKMYKDEA
jgi:hypothetical protein